MLYVCVKKINYGKLFGAYTVETGEKVTRVEINGVQMYRTHSGRYLAPWLYGDSFERER